MIDISIDATALDRGLAIAMDKLKSIPNADERRILRAAASGISIRAIARETGHSRNTVKKILKKYSKLS